MRVGGQNMNRAITQKPFGPVLCIPPELTGKRTGRHLHPDTLADKAQDECIVVTNPRQPFRVGEDRNISSERQGEQQVLHTRRQDMMRWLDEDVACVGQRQEVPTADTVNKIRHDVVVRTRQNLQRNALRLQCRSEIGDGGSNLGPCVLIEPRQNMRSARNCNDPIVNKLACHRHGRREIPGSIIDPGQQMTVQINHRRHSVSQKRADI